MGEADQLETGESVKITGLLGNNIQAHSNILLFNLGIDHFKGKHTFTTSLFPEC